MRFSILIPTFNRPLLLKAAIESALAQTHCDKEIVIVDDAPSEEAHSVALGFGTAVRYIRQEHGGKATALNHGISVSTGDVLIVLDDDDLFPPWSLAAHEQALADNRGADFSFGRFVRFRGDDLLAASELGHEESVPVMDPRRLVIKLMENCFLPHPSWAVRRQAQLRAGRYNESLLYSEDYDMILRLARKNEGAFIDKHVLYQRKHLASRGPSAERIFAFDAVHKWLKYDALLFEWLEREWDLSDFHPFANNTLTTEHDYACALLQKGIILFQRKVYERAMQTLAQYRETLADQAPTRAELRIATGLLGCRYGIADLVSGISTEISNKFKAENWPRVLRAAFASQIRWRLRAALTAGDIAYALKLAHFSHRAFGIAATAAAVGSRDRLSIR